MARLEARGTPPWLDVVDALTDQLAQLTPDPTKAQYYPIKVTTSITINAPDPAPRGARVTFDIGNGRSSGSITVSFDTAYKHGYTPPPAQMRNTVTFLCTDGVNWVQVGDQSPSLPL